MLVPEDSLRLAILLRQELFALRIDEGKMRLHALTASGEASVQLNPDRAHAQYLRAVQEVIASQILGVPHGFPNFLKRWTRAGLTRATSLAALLKLGDPEALSAVVHAEGLTNALAEHAWWVLQSPDHARAMLARDAVAQGSMGPVLAEFLVEFLGHEAHSASIVESVRLVLQPGLISNEVREMLWQRGRRRNAYRVGFLCAQPDELPFTLPAHKDWESLVRLLDSSAISDNPFAVTLQRLLSPSGQAFLAILRQVLLQSSDKWVVIRLFEGIAAYFNILQREENVPDRVELLTGVPDAPDAYLPTPATQQFYFSLWNRLPDPARPFLESTLVLSLVSSSILVPVLGNNDSVGAGLRRRMEPVTNVVLKHIDVLLAQQSQSLTG